MSGNPFDFNNPQASPGDENVIVTCFHCQAMVPKSKATYKQTRREQGYGEHAVVHATTGYLCPDCLPRVKQQEKTAAFRHVMIGGILMAVCILTGILAVVFRRR